MCLKLTGAFDIEILNFSPSYEVYLHVGVLKIRLNKNY